MVVAKSSYSKEKVKEITRKETVKAYVSSIILTAIMLALAIVYLVAGIKNDERKVMNFIFAGVMFLLCFWPITSAIKSNKNSYSNIVKEMGIEEFDIDIEYAFKERKIEMTTTRGDKVELKTIMYKNIQLVRFKKKYVEIQLDEKNAYVIQNDEFTVGTPQDLARALNKAGVNLK